MWNIAFMATYTFSHHFSCAIFYSLFYIFNVKTPLLNVKPNFCSPIITASAPAFEVVRISATALVVY
ncbi:hypothetical protein CW304_05950 [Bacillus sp. UFRGS-B20]|nr:hypothetical protein CW304_05950 [Bacillus sp. UFRGS-B20]